MMSKNFEIIAAAAAIARCVLLGALPVKTGKLERFGNHRKASQTENYFNGILSIYTPQSCI